MAGVGPDRGRRTAARCGCCRSRAPRARGRRPSPPARSAGGARTRPDVDCRCGLHAMRGTPSRSGGRATRLSAGTVALWGRVVEHELGFRAEWGYPQRLVVDLPAVLLAAGARARGCPGRRRATPRRRDGPDVRASISRWQALPLPAREPSWMPQPSSGRCSTRTRSTCSAPPEPPTTRGRSGGDGRRRPWRAARGARARLLTILAVARGHARDLLDVRGDLLAQARIRAANEDIDVSIGPESPSPGSWNVDAA